MGASHGAPTLTFGPCRRGVPDATLRAPPGAGAFRMETLLDNIFWHAMRGQQAAISSSGGTARRYARGYSPIAAFATPQRADLDCLVAEFDPGERFYTDVWSGPVPSGWQLEFESGMEKMVWDGAAVPAGDAPDAVSLGPQHAVQALALAELTRPGPFGLRTIEMGSYLGLFENGQLVAMAGERAFSGILREISGICTHPDHQGRGLAKRLTAMVIRRILQRGETPFLHVVSGNRSAHQFYRRLGFRDHRTSTVRILFRR